MIYTVTFNPALDYTVTTNSVTPDIINRASSADIHYGGKGINVSAVLTMLGIPNKALGFVGGFTGRELETMLNADNISCDFIRLENGLTRINVKIKAGQEIEINAPGPEISDDDITKLITKLSKMNSGDYLVLAGSVPKNLPPDIYNRILNKLKGKDINIVVDATGKLLTETLKYRPFLIKPNRTELGEIFDTEIKSGTDVENYAAELQRMGARNVLVSLSKNGALLLDESGAIHRIGGIKGTLVNGVGCGDSMVAGFLAGYVNTNDYEYALRLGNACGAATAFSEALATKDKLKKYM
ncbi:MAG: 1-phosphofructokinase [Ruminococcaceae bacterium]|nr:1-phosphofructokinase [Oscillospiraceae bacterium]